MSDKFVLSSLERAILESIQDDFPICHDPYGELALRVGSTRNAVHHAVQGLRRQGIIRRIGGSFVARELGYVSTLAAARVTTEQLDTVVAYINAFPEVTHNYKRDSEYNLWFTIIAESPGRRDAILANIRICPGVEALHALPALRTFKIRVHFAFAGGIHA